MNKILNWFTRKRIFIISFICTILFVSLLLTSDSLHINQNIISTNTIGYILLSLLFFVAIFIPNLILFFLKKEIFNLWRKTIVFYLIIYLIILLFIPWRDSDPYLRIEKDIIALYFSILYFISSILIIIYHLIKNKFFKK